MLSLQLDVASFEAATEEEKRQQVRMRESTTFFKDGMRRLSKNKIAMICLCLIVLVILIVAFVPSFYPYEYSDQLGITPGQPSDASYNNLKPFEYGAAERITLLGKANAKEIFLPAQLQLGAKDEAAKKANKK